MFTLTPRDTDFIDQAAERITTITTVNGTRGEVWAVLVDLEATAWSARTTLLSRMVARKNSRQRELSGPSGLAVR